MNFKDNRVAEERHSYYEEGEANIDFSINYVNKDDKQIKDPEQKKNCKIIYQGREYLHDFGTLIRKLDREQA